MERPDSLTVSAPLSAGSARPPGDLTINEQIVKDESAGDPIVCAQVVSDQIASDQMVNHQIAVLVFDFDGTLVHLDVDWPGLAARLGPPADGETLGAQVQRLRLAEDPRLDAVTQAELAGLGRSGVDAPAARTLDRLAGTHRLAIFTRNSREVVHRALDVAGVRAPIYVVGREDCPYLKPHPAGLAGILRHFGVAGHQCAVIGDTYHDVQAAKAVGAWSIVVHNPRLAYGPAGADRYVRHIDEVPHIINACRH